MLDKSEHVVNELLQLVAELEKLLMQSSGGVASHVEETVASWQETLSSARDRLSELQAQTRRRAADATKTAREAVQGNPWRSVAIAAGAGLLLGLALNGHEQRPPDVSG